MLQEHNPYQPPQPTEDDLAGHHTLSYQYGRVAYEVVFHIGLAALLCLCLLCVFCLWPAMYQIHRAGEILPFTWRAFAASLGWLMAGIGPLLLWIHCVVTVITYFYP
jgi:hypothetical protein